MGLTYYYKFEAPAETPAHRLEEFLRSVEAKTVGFQQTLVLNATFESPERQAFARRLASGFHVEDERLKRPACLCSHPFGIILNPKALPD